MRFSEAVHNKIFYYTIKRMNFSFEVYHRYDSRPSGALYHRQIAPRPYEPSLDFARNDSYPIRSIVSD